MWLTEHWQLITGGASIATLAGLFWRYGIRVSRAQKRADQCAEDLAILNNSLTLARAELGLLQASAERLIQTAIAQSGKPQSDRN